MNGPLVLVVPAVLPYVHFKQKLSDAPAATPSALVVVTPVAESKDDKVDEKAVEPQLPPETVSCSHEPAEVAAVGTVLAQFAENAES